MSCVPRNVDLRAFVVLSRDPEPGIPPHAEVLPAPLTRVAPAGSMIVNSSRGGGAKDTWLVRDLRCQESAGALSVTRLSSA